MPLGGRPTEAIADDQRQDEDQDGWNANQLHSGKFCGLFGMSGAVSETQV